MPHSTRRFWKQIERQGCIINYMNTDNPNDNTPNAPTPVSPPETTNLIPDLVNTLNSDGYCQVLVCNPPFSG